MSRLVLIVGNPRPGSRTRDVGARVADAIQRSWGEAQEAPLVLDLADLVAIGFSAAPVRPARPVPAALDTIRSAQVLLVATPSYKGTFTGLLKVFLDQLPNAGLAGVVAVPIAVAASPAHVESTKTALGTLLTELGATVPAAAGILDSTIAEGSSVEAAAQSVAATVIAALKDPAAR